MRHLMAVVLVTGLAGLACRASGGAGELVHPADGVQGARAVVADDGVVLREQPQTNAGPVATLPLGTAVAVEGALPERAAAAPGRVDYWYRVNAAGKRGWLPGWQLVARDQEWIVAAEETGQLLFFGEGKVRNEPYFSASLALLDYELRQEAVVNGYMRATVHGDLVAVLTFHDGHPEAEGRCLSTKVFGRDGRLLLDDGEGAPRVLASAKHGRIVLLPGRCREILEYQYEGTIRILDGRGKQLAEFLFFPSGRNPLFWRPGASFETVIDGSGRYFVWVAGDALCVVDLVGLRVARQRPFCQDPGFHQDWILDGIDTSGALLEMRYRSRMDQKKHQRFFLDPEKMFNRLPAVSEGCRRQAVSRDLVALFQ